MTWKLSNHGERNLSYELMLHKKAIRQLLRKLALFLFFSALLIKAAIR
jgi:hypothetical protein